MSNQIKFNYTNGGEFQLNGIDYVGYFNIDDSGNAYTEKYYSNISKELLTPESVYSADYYRSNNYRDRFVFDTIELPNKLESILIQPAEIVNFNSINSKIELLHDNIIYLHSKMFMGSTESPTDSNFYILAKKIGTDVLEWRRSTESFEALSGSPILSAYSQFDYLKRFVVIPMKSLSGYSILGISDTHIIGLTSSSIGDVLSDSKITLYTNYIDNNSNETFKSLEDIVFNGEFIYITDSSINSGGQVFKYNVKSYISNDPVFESKIYLVDTIGGLGDNKRINKFRGCTTLGTKDSELWLYDSGNKTIKIYDSNLVWLRSLGLPKTANYTILDIKYRKLDDSMYALFKNTDSGAFGLFNYNNKYYITNTYIFEDVLQSSDSSFTRLAISEQDSNVFYVSTQGTVFKKFFSKPEKTFAVFSRGKFYPDDSFIWNVIDDTWDTIDAVWNQNASFLYNFHLRDLHLIADSKDVDNLFLLGSSSVYRMKETTNYESVLRDTNLKYYNFNRIKFNKTEYNQSFVANKEFYKLFSNIIQFKNVLKGRFFFEFDKYGDLVIKDYIYFTDDEINKLTVDLQFDSFINDNELVQPNVINRLFKKIYQFQVNVIELTKIKILNLKTSVENDSNVYQID